MIILGIDPGWSGGFGIVSDTGSYCIKMPDTEGDIGAVFEELKDKHPDIIAFIELVHSMPAVRYNKKKKKFVKQGIASTAKFMYNFGALIAYLHCNDISFTRVPPIKWQTYLGCRSRGNKNVTKKRAQELFPKLKITHATADALLIAEYGRRVTKGLFTA